MAARSLGRLHRLRRRPPKLRAPWPAQREQPKLLPEVGLVTKLFLLVGIAALSQRLGSSVHDRQDRID